MRSMTISLKLIVLNNPRNIFKEFLFQENKLHRFSEEKSVSVEMKPSIFDPPLVAQSLDSSRKFVSH